MKQKFLDIVEVLRAMKVNCKVTHRKYPWGEESITIELGTGFPRYRHDEICDTLKKIGLYDKTVSTCAECHPAEGSELLGTVVVEEGPKNMY